MYWNLGSCIRTSADVIVATAGLAKFLLTVNLLGVSVLITV